MLRRISFGCAWAQYLQCGKAMCESACCWILRTPTFLLEFFLHDHEDCLFWSEMKFRVKISHGDCFISSCNEIMHPAARLEVIKKPRAPFCPVPYRMRKETIGVRDRELILPLLPHFFRPDVFPFPWAGRLSIPEDVSGPTTVGPDSEGSAESFPCCLLLPFALDTDQCAM